MTDDSERSRPDDVELEVMDGRGADGRRETLEIPEAVRRVVRERDMGMCRVCGSHGESLALHHLRYRSRGGLHVAENLISVHWLFEPRCHELMHGLGGSDTTALREAGEIAARTPGVTVLQVLRWSGRPRPTIKRPAPGQHAAAVGRVRARLAAGDTPEAVAGSLEMSLAVVQRIAFSRET